MTSSTATIRALAAHQPKGRLEPFSFDPGPLRPEQVEIEVTHCGICHSDLSMLNNDWGITQYPFVPGHEAVGRVIAAGSAVRGLPNALGNPVGRTVGIGWYSGSCMGCQQCLSGHHNHCATAESTIIGRAGAFATRLRADWMWAMPLSTNIDPAKAGPLFCAGVTVFNPIVQCGVQPTDRVGVLGVGGLGHLAVQFLNKWGCEVYAFSSNPAKRDEILALGAHHVVDSRSTADMKNLAGSLHFLISTVNANLDWAALLDTLSPRGRLHLVGVVPDPLPVQAFTLISGGKAVSGTPLGSPATVATMLDFCARHNIAPVTETFPMSEANRAFQHLEAGKARYRIVLENDLRS
jgi:alcohol/geraniol dehydrogenase (NADP+)